MPERYRFTLPDGQTHESDAGLAAIRKAHPDARVTHRVVLDERGVFVSAEPFRGKSAEPKDETGTTTTTTTTTAAPAKSAAKATKGA